MRIPRHMPAGHTMPSAKRRSTCETASRQRRGSRLVRVISALAPDSRRRNRLRAMSPAIKPEKSTRLNTAPQASPSRMMPVVSGNRATAIASAVKPTKTRPSIRRSRATVARTVLALSPSRRAISQARTNGLTRTGAARLARYPAMIAPNSRHTRTGRRG